MEYKHESCPGVSEKPQKHPLIVVAGPTASGKTSLAVELAKRFQGEIVSADSMQIYKGIPIGTAQPSEEEKQRIAHHMIGFLPPSESFSAAQYVKMARDCIEDILKRGHVPILVGGTGLYISSLIHNIQFTEEERAYSAALRRQLLQKAEEEGWEPLMEELRKRDPQEAETMDMHNRKRLARSLELCISTGKTAAQRREESRQIPSPYASVMLCLWYGDRQRLYDRINSRVDQMMAAGLLQEAQMLFEGNPSRTVRQAIGYKEFFPYFRGEISLKEAIETVKRESRRYAKRQLTWFRREPQAHWLDGGEYPSQEALFSAAETICRNCLMIN